MAQLTLYGFPPSTYTRTARLVCEEAGAPYRLEPLEFKQPSHFALHPFGRMPVLEHDSARLFETLAVTTYVDDAFNDGALQPKDAKARAGMLQWISAAVDYVYPDVVGALTHEGEPSAEALETARGHLTTLDAALAGSPFLAGHELTLADLFVFPMVEYAHGKVGDQLVRGLPNLQKWRRSIADRKSVRQTAA